MPDRLRAVFFDADGVLIDSLPQHLQICRDKAIEYGLDIAIPAPGEFRLMVSKGQKVSPMLYFFLAVGFPRAKAEKAVVDYEREFFRRYPPAAFPGIQNTLADLRKAGLKLGLATSNTRPNVEPVLARAIRHFDQDCLFFFDKRTAHTKADMLAMGARAAGAPARECVYVGDQPADARAAKDAGFRFLGVTYGWGILPGTTAFDVVDSIAEVKERLLALHVAA